ncbi:MAG: ATPase, T2SS/T4P/T4SS family [Thermodesulfobacteriota bacterium]
MTDSKQYFEDRLAEAELYKTHGLDDEAKSIYEDLLSKLGDNEKYGRLIEQIKARLEQLTGGEMVPKAPPPSAQEDSGSRLEKIDGLMDAGFYREAIDDLNKMADNTDLPLGQILFRLGQCFGRLDNPFEAIEYYKKGLRDSRLAVRDRLEILDRLSLTYEQTGAMKDAIKALELGCDIDGTYSDFQKRLSHMKETAEKSGRFFGIIANGYLVENDLEQARKTAQIQSKSIESVLLDQFSIDKEELCKSLSKYYECPYFAISEGQDLPPAPQCIRGINEKFFRTNACVPAYDAKRNLVLAVDNPSDISRVDNVRSSLNQVSMDLAVAIKEDIDKLIGHYFGKKAAVQSQQPIDDDLFEQLELVEETEEEEVVEDTAGVAEGVVVKMVNKIIEDAYARDASDIHVESMPGKRGVLIRFRVDGDCAHYKTIPAQYKRAIVSRIKIISKLDISERRLPQDGKIKFKTRAGKIIELRVATLPTVGANEDVVMRILAASGAMPLEKMGLLEHNFNRFTETLATPYGLVLVVGPTGSGKTTTLHAALAKINTPERKVWTAEDPVEIVQNGLRQVQVQSKIELDFARVLRAFLRADPDVIMVGETRDEETAEIVVESALTGHLVFSTLHTNSAPETVTRLLGMGIDPFNFADSLLCVLAQRLARRLCPNCKESFRPDAKEAALFKALYGEHPVHPLAGDALGQNIFRAKGCAKCQHSGSKGRMAVHELLTNNEVLKELIATSAPVGQIKKEAMAEGMTTLLQDGIIKVLAGDTDLQQIRAVCA